MAEEAVNMIFYFTGTGNSLMTAKALLEPDEKLVSIAKTRKTNQYEFDIPDGERVGLVFPVYFYTLSDIILDFVQRLRINKEHYFFAVITCGGGIGGSGYYLSREFAKKGLQMNYVESLLMPDDTVFYYNLKPKQETDERVETARQKLVRIRKELEREVERCPKKMPSKGFRTMYHLALGTGKFWATDACIGCGKCAKNCPDEAIEIRDGKPVWKKDKCIKCTACINRCPVHAIQYGKGTLKRIRYVNPDMEKDF